MAAQVNVYVPDEMKDRLEKANLNLSYLAREAWERALGNAAMPGEIHKFEIEARKDEEDVFLRFEAEELGGGVYRTPDGKAVMIMEEDYYVITPDEIDRNPEALKDSVWDCMKENYGTHPDEEEFGQVLRAFGITPVIDL